MVSYGRSPFYVNGVSVLGEVKHANHSRLGIVLRVEGLGVYEKGGDYASVLSCILSVNDVCGGIVSGNNELDVGILAYELVVNINSVICIGYSAVAGRGAVKCAVLIEIRVCGDDDSAIGVCLYDVLCP